MRHLIPCLAMLLLVACRPEAPAPSQPDGQAAPSPDLVEPLDEDAAVPELKDTVETDPRFIIGVSYPPEANRYPGLAAALHRYTQAARRELMDAVDERGDDAGGLPYDLSLTYSTVVSTPDILAVAADGTMFTGGAHGAPLVARFVWLPAQDRPLAVSDLFPEDRAWRDISAFVREELHAALSHRIDADDLEPAERERIVRTAGKMIDEGSAPDEENFSQYEPVVGADGRVHALRFVFPPYQVGPYSDGIQTVDVPASVVLPHVAGEYRALFAGG